MLRVAVLAWSCLALVAMAQCTNSSTWANSPLCWDSRTHQIICACGEACDDTLGCVSCQRDAECAGNTGDGGYAPALFCVEGACSQCRSNADCAAHPVVGGAPAPACWTDHFCHAACTSSQDCPPQAVDDEPAAPICDTVTGACVQCIQSSDCPADQPVCNRYGECGCGSDADCPTTAPRCAALRTCVPCLDASDCGAGEACDNTVCRPACHGDADCGGDTPVCDGDGCVQCATDLNCGDRPATPYCVDYTCEAAP
ncbi:MAG TPA: hypothetical protein VLX92_35100 [Kofleriaceae bacterium]|nr:hypothetical protein [Kofleriaceae bacterium]